MHKKLIQDAIGKWKMKEKILNVTFQMHSKVDETHENSVQVLWTALCPASFNYIEHILENTQSTTFQVSSISTAHLSRRECKKELKKRSTKKMRKKRESMCWEGKISAEKEKFGK